MLVLGSLGWGDRKETNVLQLICSVSLIAKRSGFSRTIKNVPNREGSEILTTAVNFRILQSPDSAFPAVRVLIVFDLAAELSHERI